MKPRVLIMAGYGLNCEEETKNAFEKAGGFADIIHINDLIDGVKKLKDKADLLVSNFGELVAIQAFDRHAVKQITPRSRPVKTS